MEGSGREPDRNSCGTRYPRRIDRAFVRGRRPGRRLRRHIGRCASCRERYDRLAHASAALAPWPLAAEVLDDIGDDVVARASRSHPGGFRWLGAGVTVAAAVAVIFLFFWPSGAGEEHFAPRGDFEALWEGDRAPGIRLFCVGNGESGAEVMAEGRLAVPAMPGPLLRCNIDSELQLVYSTPSLNGLTMVAFGKSDDGRTFYYAPRRGDDDSVVLAPDRIDEPLDWSTQLAVKHAPGRYQLTVRFFEGSVTASAAVEGAVSPLWEIRGALEVADVGGGTR